eukprot:5520252-Pleurochrysis_carterae.AAC.2
MQLSRKARRPQQRCSSVTCGPEQRRTREQTPLAALSAQAQGGRALVRTVFTASCYAAPLHDAATAQPDPDLGRRIVSRLSHLSMFLHGDISFHRADQVTHGYSARAVASEFHVQLVS